MGEIGRQFEAALTTGFRAVKMEVLFYDLVDDAELVGLIREGRRMLGDKILMALDFGYRWQSWHDARWVLDRVADCNIYFAEATLQHDDLAGHAQLAAVSPIRICGAEAAATRWEIREWLERGRVAIVQPNIGRGGGLTEIRRIADLCELLQCPGGSPWLENRHHLGRGPAFSGGLPGGTSLRIRLAKSLRQPAAPRAGLAGAHHRDGYMDTAHRAGAGHRTE